MYQDERNRGQRERSKRAATEVMQELLEMLNLVPMTAGRRPAFRGSGSWEPGSWEPGIRQDLGRGTTARVFMPVCSCGGHGVAESLNIGVRAVAEVMQELLEVLDLVPRCQAPRPPATGHRPQETSKSS